MAANKGEQKRANLWCPGIVGPVQLPHAASFVFVVFFVFLDLSLFFKKQFLDLLTLSRIGRDFEQLAIVLTVLSYHKALHHRLHARSPSVSLELDQCGFV